MQPLAAAPVLWAGQGSTVSSPAHLGTTGPPAACGARVETAAATPPRAPVSVAPVSTGPAASTPVHPAFTDPAVVWRVRASTGLPATPSTDAACARPACKASPASRSVLLAPSGRAVCRGAVAKAGPPVTPPLAAVSVPPDARGQPANLAAGGAFSDPTVPCAVTAEVEHTATPRVGSATARMVPQDPRVGTVPPCRHLRYHPQLFTQPTKTPGISTMKPPVPSSSRDPHRTPDRRGTITRHPSGALSWRTRS